MQTLFFLALTLIPAREGTPGTGRLLEPWR